MTVDFDPFDDSPESPDLGASLEFLADSKVWRPLPPDKAVASVDIIHLQDHKFKKKAKAEGKTKPPPGCAVCNAAKQNMVHVGAPPSLNASGSGGNHFVYQGIKNAWEERLTHLMEAAGLPRGLGRVYAEAQVCFPSLIKERIGRDQGNYRHMLEKALGDALERGGWIQSDAWDFYEFGPLRATHERGTSWTSITLHPEVAIPPTFVAQEEQATLL